MTNHYIGPADKQQAKRFNRGKPRLSLLLAAPDALEGITRVLEYGAEKYGRDNWLQGLPFTEVVDSALRHLLKWFKGEELDEESGLPHVDHIACNVLFICQFWRTHNDFDDRAIKQEE